MNPEAGKPHAHFRAHVTARLIEPAEKARRDVRIFQRHDPGNAQGVGRPLRYGAELDGERVALPGWNVAADPLNGREGLGRPRFRLRRFA